MRDIIKTLLFIAVAAAIIAHASAIGEAKRYEELREAAARIEADRAASIECIEPMEDVELKRLGLD